jgi:uncharacterized protein (DUF305 family)
MTRTAARLTGLAGAILAGALALTGCSGTNDTAAGGNSSASSSAGQTSDHTAAGVAFASDMLPHHQSAVAMAELADRRAGDARVLDLARRIQAAQQPEIDTLSGWLSDWGATAPSSASDDMGGMGNESDSSKSPGSNGGMMSDQDMSDLMNASGAEFDRKFLELMSAHRSSAVEMAETEIGDGQNADTIAMATTIRDSQAQEIEEMKTLLGELGG